MSGIGDYYEQKRIAQAGGYELVALVEALVTREYFVEALSIIRDQVGPTYYKSRVCHYFSNEDRCKAGIARLREMAHEAGNTGD